MKTDTKASTLQIPLIQKIAAFANASTFDAPSSCCTPKNNVSVCCTPNDAVTESDTPCCPQPEDGSSCCDK